MGVKITVDSATLANKGLEVIEACRLFDFDADDVQVVVHPESIVHSLVRLKDGVVYAQLSEPDMKHPILSALRFPKIEKNSMRPFDLTDTEKPRIDDFPMLRFAFNAAKIGKSAPIAFNAANEIAVGYFVNGKIPFYKIADSVEFTLSQKKWNDDVRDLADIMEADKTAREISLSYFSKIAGKS